MSLHHYAVLPFLCLGLVGISHAQEPEDDVPEGHSSHGEVFNEGPRQAAYLMDRPASVQFPVTAKHVDTQAFFNQGIGQLHGFWYFEAERTFRQVAANDPDCAMAYWGMAMANVDNKERATGFANEAWSRREHADEREKLYIDSLARFYEADKVIEKQDEDDKEEEKDSKDSKDAKSKKPKKDLRTPEEKKKESDKRRDEQKKAAQKLVHDYESIIWAYPDDIEAKALLVNRLWMNRRFGHATTSRHANEAILDQIFAVQPNHPAHHYRIHLWDAADSAEFVVNSAARNGQAWPGIAHMWHMSGHIFARLGRHSDAAWQQEASARVDHAAMIRDRVLPDQTHNFAHNNEWLTRSLRHHGRVAESVDLAKNMIELPRHPKYNRLDKGGCSAFWGRRRLLETLELYEQWDELVALCSSMYLEPSDDDGDKVQRAYVLGKAHAYRGDLDGFDAQVARMEELLAEAKVRRSEAITKAEDESIEAEESKTEVMEGMQAVIKTYQTELSGLRDKIESLIALEAVLAGEHVEENIAILEKRGFEKAHLARFCLEADLNEKAEKLARKAIEKRDGRIYFTANLAHVLASLDKQEEALETFDALREYSSRANLDMPVFERLAPLAKLRELPADWRTPVSTREDIGERPDLATLGPIRWTPPEALPWTAQDGLGKDVSLSDYEGRPVLVVFFLGFGCVHCVEQLQALEPAVEDFRSAGIEIVTIGTNTVAELAEAEGEGEDREQIYPFPILSNADLDLFKLYRAYDDFEDMPLHGTFLVDGKGKVRWQDISYEPFMDTEFLLKESKRLLALPSVSDNARNVSSQGR
ncbi:MAG: peroxiredoxin [Planctomycetota bacterium]|jgi:peroxiredoxin